MQKTSLLIMIVTFILIFMDKFLSFNVLEIEVLKIFFQTPPCHTIAIVRSVSFDIIRERKVVARPFLGNEREFILFELSRLTSNNKLPVCSAAIPFFQIRPDIYNKYFLESGRFYFECIFFCQTI